MKSVIVGTAGHIDHGKTALVKALTGIDADRLEEEKRRGITIDIGFAHLELEAPSGEALQLGFVDVPGHERFVRNMLAGIGGIDLVLFVVAADEGIKPQTREHFDICRLLHVQRGICVLTKSDLVDADTLQVVRLEVAEFLRGSFLDAATAPMVAVSSKSGDGMELLKRELARLAAATQAKDSAAYFRLPIDRVFTMKGFGTVVTGTLISGSVQKEAEAEIFPQRTRTRVRGIEVHGQPAERAVAGERTALNLAGNRVSTEELARGMVLAEPGVFEPAQRLDVALSLLTGSKPLRDRARVHLHAYTFECSAIAVLHEGKSEIRPGESGFAQLRLADATLLLPGDRFILRQFSPLLTIGGGVVLDAAPLKQAHEALHVFLKVLSSGSPGQILQARIARRGAAGLPLQRAIAETGWLKNRIEALAATLEKQGAILQVENTLLHAPAIAGLKSFMLATLMEFHDQTPLVDGLSKPDLCERLGVPLPAFTAALNALLAEKRIEATGELVRTAGRGVVMSEQEAASKRAIEAAFLHAGLKVPALTEVLSGLKIDRVRAERLVTLLLREKALVKLTDDLVFHREALHALRKLVSQYKLKSPKIDVGTFKELTGVSRKYAIPLLEYLDRERVTRRAGDERIIL